jgi:hypothetical protein
MPPWLSAILDKVLTPEMVTALSGALALLLGERIAKRVGKRSAPDEPETPPRLRQDTISQQAIVQGAIERAVLEQEIKATLAAIAHTQERHQEMLEQLGKGFSAIRQRVEDIWNAIDRLRE